MPAARTTKTTSPMPAVLASVALNTAPNKVPIMPPKFGTSGLRGLVINLTDNLVGNYTQAFINACDTGGTVQVGRDLRPSSPDIANAVIDAIRAAGLTAIDHGALPTPALALASMAAGHGAVMVTGSHIPADRNGLKFYVPNGEIGKEDEQAILAHLDVPKTDTPLGPLHRVSTSLATYVVRYASAFGPSALSGLRIGVYEHSSVARDVLYDVLQALGADSVPLARSDSFIPVDTEAVDPASRTLLADWAKTHALDAIVSTDGDGDRPMVTDETGTIIVGDVLGALTAAHLGATTLVTSVSSNSMIEQMAQFTSIHRTRIGSPYVIAAMEAQPAGTKVAGYEANGGFILGFTAQGPAGDITPLMTRDSVLPIIAPLAAAKAQGLTLAQLVATLPAIFTASDRVQNIATEKSGAFVKALSTDPAARAAFFENVGPETNIDLIDGLRVTFEHATIHIRPSGNAPECRCYVEANSTPRAITLLNTHLAKLAKTLG